MQSSVNQGIYTYFEISPSSNTSGAHYLTLPDGPGSFKRLHMNNIGQVKMTEDRFTGDQVSFWITEAQ